MTAIIAALPALLQSLPLIVTSTQAFIQWIAGVRLSAQQTGEWTPEADAAFINWLLTLAKQSQWQPDQKAP